MARTSKILFYRPNTDCDAYGEADRYAVGPDHFVGSVWAERTEAGGRENLYASRITNPNEVTFSFRWVPWVTPEMLLEVDGRRWPIISLSAEGFRRMLHAKIQIRHDNE